MKKKILLTALLFLVFSTIYHLQPTMSLAQSATPSAEIQEQPSLIESIISFFRNLFSSFIKTNYTIDPNNPPDSKNFMDYGQAGDNNPIASTNRFRFSEDQFCDRGRIIKNVILSKEEDSKLALACFSPTESKCLSLNDPIPEGLTCTNITISTLAFYKLQKNEPFYCDDTTKEKVEISEDIKTAILNKNINTALIADSCYENILNNFPLAPPSTDEDTIKADTDENIQGMTKQIIFKEDQKDSSNKELYNQAATGVIFTDQNSKKGFNILKFK